MINCKILVILILVIACRTSLGQTFNNSQKESIPSPIDINPSQAMGYEFLGMGAASIIYSGAGISQTKLPNAGYAGGGVMAITGAMLLIFGDKEPGINYWKGYDGIRPDHPHQTHDIIVQKRLFLPDSGITKFYLEKKFMKH